MPDYVRVTDTDTGHKLTVLRSEVANGNYRELKADAVDHNGDPLPPEFGATKPLSSTNEGQTATDTKEK
jgi:hypothetical protein